MVKRIPFIPTSESKGSKKTKTPVLDNFGRDLTVLAEQDKLDPVVGREKEIERVSQVLSRRKKNNPLLIGEPGVGKSAIAEGLALRIIQKASFTCSLQQKSHHSRSSEFSRWNQIQRTI
jgi:ATP-dependent Clp protease ATP-binding subunit ClpC